MSPPVLALPNSKFKYTIDNDACLKQVGCVLLQAQPYGRHIAVGYYSRSLMKAECSYDTTEKASLAVVFSVTILEPYLNGAYFTIRTDHDALRGTLNIPDPKTRPISIVIQITCLRLLRITPVRTERSILQRIVPIFKVEYRHYAEIRIPPAAYDNLDLRHRTQMLCLRLTYVSRCLLSGPRRFSGIISTESSGYSQLKTRG